MPVCVRLQVMLVVTFVCIVPTRSLSTTSPVADTADTTSSIISSHHDNHSSVDEHTAPHESHSIHVIHIAFEEIKEPLIFTIVVLLAGLSKILFHHADFLSSKVPESCMLIVLGIIFGAILHFSDLAYDLPELFSPHRFFVFLLPPIILESAFSLYDRTFSENLGSVLLFAVVGTILSCFLIGLTLYGLMLGGAMGPHLPNMTLVQILVFSSLIVAVDPVAVLAVFNEVGVNHVLYFIVFGESLLNDGVTVVLYKVMQSFNLMDTIDADQIVLGIVKFFVVCLGGLVLGILSGIGTALLTKYTVQVRVVQPLVIYMMAYLGFLMSELFEVSGIISIIGCGLVQRHYAFSNISDKSRTTVKYFTKVLASASEIIIFLFLGLSMVNDQHDWHTGFVLWTLLLCLLYRFLIVFGMASLINRFDQMRVRRIGKDEMFMIAFGGLRGAVAFSLAALLDEEDLNMKKMFVTTTLAVVIFTVFVQGITIKPLVNLLSIKLAPEKNRSMYCELSSHVTDHLMAGIEDVVGMRGRNHFREKLEQLDVDYMRKWFMNDPDPADVDLQNFYQKIVVKEHYKYLQLCGAATVQKPANLPHVDTSMYLNTEAEDHGDDETIQTRLSLSGEGEPTTPKAVLRRERTRGTPSSPEISDARGLRSLLMTMRTSRLLLHTNYDRNLTTEDDLGTEIQKKSAQNRNLQRLMSRVRPPMDRCASWAEEDTQICQQRSTQAGSGGKKTNKRSATVDLGSAVRMGTYSPLGSATTSPMTPTTPLDAVFEENETETDPGDQTKESEKQMEETIPLMDDSQPPAAVVRGNKSKKSRNKLQRQDDLRPEENKEHDEAV